MMNDDRFDELLQEAAREHNSAPETPRSEMWAAIAAARGTARAGGAAPAATTAPAPVRVIPLYTRHRRALGWAAGLAATLLVGILIGRATTAPAPQSRVAATAKPPAASNAADDPGKMGPGPVIPMPTGPSNTAEGSAIEVAQVPHEGRREPPIASESRSGVRSGTLARREAARADAAPYRVAAMQHLVTTEALLVSLRSDVRAGRKDTTIATWAGQLLGTTRMLMDSPAGRDPQLKQLLEDLELVLAQISRLPGAQGEAADLGLIDDAVRHRQIMTRLRALSPDT
ncbi:MAG TPA: hypothetical protein VG432_01340 [Gemmatimonadaceae bacterium]|nr:hypothetical protein [Gemmatimonadaceae bacterium]